MPKCTCMKYYAGRETPIGDYVGWSVQPTGIRIFTPGCTVHSPPADEDDRYSFETPPLQGHPSYT